MVHAFSPAGERLYAIGGGTANGSSTVDNRVYDPKAGSRGAWRRLPDLPFSSGNFQTNGASSFIDRYIILVGGYQYAHV